MLNNIRIIPRLDIKGPNLVKGIHLEGLRVLGKPWDFALKYYEDGADELIYIDTVANLYGRNTITEIVEKTAQNIFIPLTVGGGIRSLDDVKKILRAGADKVTINTAAVRNPDLISKAAEVFGSQCIIVSIAAKYINNRYEAMMDNGRESSDKEVTSWAKEAVDLGAGEILLTSIDNDGTGVGYDMSLINSIANAISVPVIVCGGCGRPEHMVSVIKECNVDAVSAASIFHYHYLEHEVDRNNFTEEGNIEFIKNNRDTNVFMQNKIISMSIKDVKKRLIDDGIKCRYL